MSRRDPRIAFQQMLNHAEEAVRLCEGRVRTDLNSDRLLNLALVRLLEIIGEASNRVLVEVQLQYPQIPWLQIVGLRNRLIHGYVFRLIIINIRIKKISYIKLRGIIPFANSLQSVDKW